MANDVETDGNEGREGEGDVPPESTDVERVAERTEEESQAGTEDCGQDGYEQTERQRVGQNARLQIPPLMRPVTAKKP